MTPGQLRRYFLQRQSTQINYSSGLYGLTISFTSYKQILPKKCITSLRWPEDSVSIALTGAYLLGLAAGAVVLLQARRVTEPEDQVMCAVAHKMRCKRCHFDETPVNQRRAPLPTHLHLQALDTLPASIILSLALCSPLRVLSPTAIGVIRMLMAGGALTVAHRLFFLAHTKYRSARRLNWPTSILFSGRVIRKIFRVGNVAACVISLYTVVHLFADERLAWHTSLAARAAITIALMAVAANVVVLVRSIQMAAVKAQAVCMREGHRWKCVRWCSTAEDTEAIAVQEVSAVGKFANEPIKEVCLFCFFLECQC